VVSQEDGFPISVTPKAASSSDAREAAPEVLCLQATRHHPRAIALDATRPHEQNSALASTLTEERQQHKRTRPLGFLGAFPPPSNRLAKEISISQATFCIAKLHLLLCSYLFAYMNG